MVSNELPTPRPRMWLKALRKDKGLSHRQLGKLLGVSHVTVMHWEDGKRNPRPEMIAALARHLGTEVLHRFNAEWHTRMAEAVSVGTTERRAG